MGVVNSAYLSCDTCLYPKLLGGAAKDMVIEGFDLDDNFNMAVLGSTTGTDNLPKSVIGYIEYSTCDYKWLHEIGYSAGT